MGAGESSCKPDLILKGIWKALGSESNLKNSSWVSPEYMFDFDRHDESAKDPSRTFCVYKAGYENIVSYGRIARFGKDIETQRIGVYDGDSTDPEERRLYAVLMWTLVTEKDKTYYFKATVGAEFREDTATLRGIFGTRPDYTGPEALTGSCIYDFWRVSPLKPEEIEERRRIEEESNAKVDDEKSDGKAEDDKKNKKKKVDKKMEKKSKNGLTAGKKLSIALEVLLETVVTRIVAFIGFFAALNWQSIVKSGQIPTWDALLQQSQIIGVPAVFVLHFVSGWISALQQILTMFFVKSKDSCDVDEPWWFGSVRFVCFLLRSAAYATVGWTVGDAAIHGGYGLAIATPVSSVLRTRAGLPTSVIVLFGFSVVFDLLRMSAFGVRVRNNGAWGTEGICSIGRLVEPMSSLISTALFVAASAALLVSAGFDVTTSEWCIIALVVTALHFTVDLVANVLRDTSLIESNISYVRYAAQTKKLFFLFI